MGGKTVCKFYYNEGQGFVLLGMYHFREFPPVPSFLFLQDILATDFIINSIP